MAVWRRQGLLRQSNPGVPLGVIVYLRVSARTGRRSVCDSFPPSSGSTAMSILCVEWLCTQGRWNQEVVIIFGAAARYRRAPVCRSHIDAHPDNSTLHTGGVSPPNRFYGEPLLHIAPYGPWQFASVRNVASFFVYFVGVSFSCEG
jgi:hypothetical protein